MDTGAEPIADDRERVIVRAQGRWVTRTSVLIATAITVALLALPRVL